MADVAHRTEIGAVRLSVTPEALPGVVDELRSLAGEHGANPTVAVQPMVAIAGEAFIGLQGASELGPMVAFGPGGVLVEALNRIGGRMAPFDRNQAAALIDEFADLKILHGFRGKPPWGLDELADILVAAGNLAAGGAEWIESIDINPLVWTGSEFVAVDALVIVRP